MKSEHAAKAWQQKGMMAMPIHLEWDTEEHRAVVWKFIPGWTWEEFNESIEKTWEFAHEDENAVDVILDIGAGVLIPRNATALEYIRQGVEACASQGGVVVAATPNPVARSFVHIFRLLNRELSTHFYVANSIADARRIIASGRKVNFGH